jgi:hypothetical protein
MPIGTVALAIATSAVWNLLMACLLGAGSIVLGSPRIRNRMVARTLRQRREMSLPTSVRSERWALVGIAVVLAGLAVWSGVLAALSLAG